jgi:Ser/Thr protein kinase RdoA (MazF antagonist)
MSADAQHILTAFLGPEAARSTMLEPILGGESSASLYQFDHDSLTYVLRLLAPKSPRSRHHHEVSLTRAAGVVGVGPRVHFVAADESAIIYEYTHGQTLTLDNTREAPVLVRLAQQLGRLHHSRAEVPAATSPFERFYGFRQRSIEGKRLWPEVMARAAEFVTRLDSEWQQPVNRPCHLDLHARNIILTSTRDPVMIDWVNGGMSDPAFDLATLIVFLGLRDGYRDHFLTSYQESTGEALDMSRIELLMPIRPLVASAGCLVDTPPEVSLSQLEQELDRTQRPGHEFFIGPHEAWRQWPRWKLGLILLRMGLSHMP